MKRLVTALAFVVATSVGAFAQGFPLPSGWTNQRGSDMDLYPAPPPPNGNFTGNYYNHAPGFQCQNGPNNPVPYRITGQANGAAVTFKVVWNNGIVSRWPGLQIPYPAPLPEGLGGARQHKVNSAALLWLKALLACWLTAITVLVWLAMLPPPTFHDRFGPAIRHPLHSMARQGYCYPRMCRIG